MNRFIQIITAILVMLGMMALASCRYEVSSSRNADNTIIKDIKVKPFENIKVESSATVHYEQGKSVSVRIEGEKSDLNNFNISSDGHTLVIERKHRVIFGIEKYGDVDIYITSPDIVGLYFSGSGEFIAKKHVDTDNLSISLYGSGDVNFHDIICDNLNSDITGSGDINLTKVICARSKFSCVGSGNIKAGVYRSNDVNVLLQGSGDIELDMKDCVNVNADIQGSGDIKLSGNVKKMKKNVMGSGDYNIDKLCIEK
jgi:hypothetical protein